MITDMRFTLSLRFVYAKQILPENKNSSVYTKEMSISSYYFN